MDYVENIYQAVVDGSLGEVTGFVQAALDAGVPASEILHWQEFGRHDARGRRV